MSPRDVIFIFTVLAVGAFTLLWPASRAIAERIRSRGHPAVKDQAPPSDDLREELEQLRREVAELGERVDFHERLLAKSREPERLPPTAR